MQRGNLVIYDETGKIISQTGEAMGDILPHKYPVGVPYVELPYGAYYVEFQTSKLVGINPATKEPIFEPFEITIDEVKRLKIQQLNEQCTSEILMGFEYVKDGITYLLGFDEQDQSNLTQQMAILSVSPEPIVWKVKGELVFLQFTKDEFLQMGLVAKQHKESKMQKYYQLCVQVQACTDKAGVDAIVW